MPTTIIGVMGAGVATAEELQLSYELGKAIAITKKIIANTHDIK